MRASGAICGWMLATAAWLPALAEDGVPYTAYVNSDDVYVRSGPGQNYYPTSKLKVGEAVEVYRHDPGGWYAIRPPEGSFCWVAVRYLTLGRDKLAVINGDRVVARVGSSFSDIRDVIQVRLERGEEVDVLETKILDAAQGGERWAKVAPVAGEFRWVLGKFLDRTPPEPALLADKANRNVLLSKQRDNPLPAVRGQNEQEPVDQEAERVSKGGSGSAKESAFRPVRSSSDSKTARQVSFDPEGESEPNELPAAEKNPSASSKRPRAVGNTAKESDFQTQLDQIDLEISQMVAEEPTVWDLDDLRARAETALSRAQTAVERGRARLVLSKIDRFQEIKQRFARVADAKTASSKTEAQAGPAATAGPTNATQAAKSADPLSRFDGAGRLTAVVSLRIGTPHFALVDNAGAIRAYVTPAPGVNLRPYLGRNIGISGARGFMPEFNASHVTARQITILEQPLLR